MDKASAITVVLGVLGMLGFLNFRTHLLSILEKVGAVFTLVQKDVNDEFVKANELVSVINAALQDNKIDDAEIKTIIKDAKDLPDGAKKIVTDLKGLFAKKV